MSPCCEHPDGPSACPNHAPKPDRLIEYPPLIVYEHDLSRFRTWALRNRMPDSAAAFRALLDQADAYNAKKS